MHSRGGRWGRWVGLHLHRRGGRWGKWVGLHLHRMGGRWGRCKVGRTAPAQTTKIKKYASAGEASSSAGAASATGAAHRHQTRRQL